MVLACAFHSAVAEIFLWSAAHTLPVVSGTMAARELEMQLLQAFPRTAACECTTEPCPRAGARAERGSKGRDGPKKIKRGEHAERVRLSVSAAANALRLLRAFRKSTRYVCG